MPPVAARQAATKRSSGSPSRPARTSSATPSRVSGPGCSSSAAGSVTSSASASVCAEGSAGRLAQMTHHRQVVDAPGEVGEEAQRRRVRPVRVIDREQHGAALRQVRAQPVEAVEDGEGRVDHRALRAGRRFRGRARTGRAARDAAPPSSSSRCSGGAPSSGGSSSCRTTPCPNSSSSSDPRAVSTRSPAARASSRAAATSCVLPIPATPSTTMNVPRPSVAATRASWSRASSRSRSSRRAEGPGGASWTSMV